MVASALRGQRPGSARRIELADVSSGDAVSRFRAWRELFGSFVARPMAEVVTASRTTPRIWDTLDRPTSITLTGRPGAVRGAVFSPDGERVLTTSEDTTARLWDAASGKELRQFKGHTAWCIGDVFSPDAKYIVTAGWDGTARVWVLKPDGRF